MRSAETVLRERLAGLLTDLPPPEADALARLLDRIEASLSGTAPPPRPTDRRQRRPHTIVRGERDRTHSSAWLLVPRVGEFEAASRVRLGNLDARVASRGVLKLILFVLPLGLDTFAAAAALGMRGLPRRQRLRVSLLMSGFEMAMPVVGVLLGHAFGSLVGGSADYVAIGVLALLGVWMVIHDEEEGGKVAQLAERQGLVLLALGISISLDELAIGFTIGLLDLSTWLAVALIGAQAFFFAQIGLRLGALLNETLRERAEQLAGLALLGLALLLVVEKLS